MPLADLNPALTAVTSIGPLEFFLTVSVFIVMISVVSICTCCSGSKNQRESEDECDYGVVTVSTAPNPANKPPPIHTINFRDTSSKRLQDRHSQPSSNNTIAFNRQSAPGRALPKLPADLYTPIDKKPKTDDIRFADESVNPMYECIDAETDSFVDPLYSKVGAPVTSTARERKYDYPIFSGRQQKRNKPDETLYQSASQIYVAGSEDPYSSITSERGRNPTFAEGDGDNSSAYDPGYAKVKLDDLPKGKEDRKKEKIERTERELDLLYSKIRRTVPNYTNEELAGPSRLEPDIPAYNHMTGPTQPTTFDQQSAISSREPSYRYITMRENAEIVRERLRQQGQLDRPRREHYYSTIGNDYETINNSPFVSAEPQRVEAPLQAPLADISTIIEMDVPPPPTSPVPGRSRPVSIGDTSHLYSGILKPSSSSIPPPPDLRCSPVPPRPPCEEQMFSIVNAKIAAEPIGYKNRYNNEDDSNTKAGASYRSMETLMSKRTVEEKETIIEKRSTYASGIQIPSTSSINDIMSRSADNYWNITKPVHEVPIQRTDKNYDSGPGVDVIISGRRYRSGQALFEEPKIPAESSVEGNKTETNAAIKNEPESDTETTTHSQRSARRKTSRKEETEDERIKRLGTIYTANDYVSQMDMTDEKPWPFNNTNTKKN